MRIQSRLVSRSSALRRAARSAARSTARRRVRRVSRSRVIIRRSIIVGVVVRPVPVRVCDVQTSSVPRLVTRMRSIARARRERTVIGRPRAGVRPAGGVVVIALRVRPGVPPHVASSRAVASRRVEECSRGVSNSLQLFIKTYTRRRRVEKHARPSAYIDHY